MAIRLSRSGFFLFLLLCGCVSVSANAGTKLMWAGFLHLVFGNLFIGLGEAWLLARWFKLDLKWCGVSMIAANYAAAWLGAWLVDRIGMLGIDFTIENVSGWLWRFVGMAFLVSLVVEYPFVWWCLRREPARWPRSVKATVVIQAISYVVLFGWYYSAARISALADLKVVQVGEMNLNTNVIVYFVADDSGQVVGRLKEGKAHAIRHQSPSGVGIDRLSVSNRIGGGWDLLAVEVGSLKVVALITNLPTRSVAREREAAGYGVDGTWMAFGETPSLAATNEWEFETDYWAGAGVGVKNLKTDAYFRIALETPFVQWIARNATELPDGKLLFQFGKNQICILDAERREIALWARGRGPVVAVE